MDDIRTASTLRSEVGKLLQEAAERGTEFLPGDLSQLSFRTDVRLVEASAMGLGDPFPAELEILTSQQEEQQESTDLLAFRIAMALHRR